MKIIYKYCLEVGIDVQELCLLEEGDVLCVDFIQQECVIYMWVEVDVDIVIDIFKEVCCFKVFVIGSGIFNNVVYIGIILDILKFEVFYVYELVD